MASDLLLESGDRLLLESGDALLLELSDLALPLIDDSSVMPPTTSAEVTVDLPLLDDGSIFAPSLAVSSAVGLIDDSQVFAPSILFDQFLALGLVDGGWAFGPAITRESDVGTFAVLVNGEERADLFARSFEDQLSDIGSFSFQMLRSDFFAGLTWGGEPLYWGGEPLTWGDAKAVAFDDEITFVIDGTPVFLGVVKGLEHTALAQGEDADQVVTVNGPGMLGEFANHVVYPSRGVGALPIEDVRSLSWVSPDFDPAAEGWPLAKTINFVRNYAATGTRRPTVWPRRAGKWIWGDRPGVTQYDAPQGICLFRKTITLASEKTVRFFFAGDNVMRIWIDAAEMTWFAGSAHGRYVDIELGAGDHVIAAKVANKVDVPGEDNPAGFTLVGFSLDEVGLLDELVVETNGTWRCLPYPIHAPGFYEGEATWLLMQEANLDATWARDFSDTIGSDGEAFTFKREVAVNVGRTLLDFERERMDAWADVWCAPGSKTLRLTNRGGRGVVRSVTLQQTTDPATSDFLALSHSGNGWKTDKILGRYADGHTESGSGDLSAYLELGVIESETEALEILEAQLASRATPRFSTTATIFPRSDATTPYKGFEVGDWITCPNEDDTPELMRVNSIAYSEDAEGVVEWIVRLRDQQLEDDERHDAWLRRMADGTMVGGARVSSRKDTPAPTAQQISVLKVAEFSYDNTALTVSTSPMRPAEQSGNVVQVYGLLTTAGSTTTTVEVTVNGTLLATLSFPAGETEASEAIGIVPVLADVSKAQVSITAVGTGAEGLDVQIRAI